MALTAGVWLSAISGDGFAISTLRLDFERHSFRTRWQKAVLDQELRDDDFQFLDQCLKCVGAGRQAGHVFARRHPDLAFVVPFSRNVVKRHATFTSAVVANYILSLACLRRADRNWPGLLGLMPQM